MKHARGMGAAAAAPMAACAAGDAVLSVEHLKGPWSTDDPFLFAVHHDDRYPPGDAELGPDRALLDGRHLGSDFGHPEWNMYHGERVPGFPKHPHRGFETVSVVRHGVIDHTDSLGSSGRFGGGDVQWMTAGAGISHSEMFPLLNSDGPNRVELFQIWLNLPRARKMAPPHFKMLWSEQLPRLRFQDEEGRETEVTLVAGALGEAAPPAPPPASWATEPGSGLAIWTLRMTPGAVWELPAAAADVGRSLYCFAGAAGASATVGGRPVAAPTRLKLRPDVAVELRAGARETEFLLLQGRPIGEPVVSHGPFVMTSSAEIRETFADYQRTGFGGWPWPSDSVVHPREKRRFAEHADGRVEAP